MRKISRPFLSKHIGVVYGKGKPVFLRSLQEVRDAVNAARLQVSRLEILLTSTGSTPCHFSRNDTWSWRSSRNTHLPSFSWQRCAAHGQASRTSKKTSRKSVKCKNDNGLKGPESGLKGLRPTSLMHCLLPEVMRPIFRKCKKSPARQNTNINHLKATREHAEAEPNFNWS